MAHELVHVKQFRLNGLIGFGLTYVLDYRANKKRGMTNRDAYENISFEREATDYARNVINAIRNQYGNQPCEKYRL